CERILLNLIGEVRAFNARQVVEPVTVLQVLHLQLEDEVEGRTQHAVVQVLFLGEAADPEVDLVETGDGAGRVRRRIRVKSRIARRVDDRVTGIRIDLNAVNGARI